MEPDTPNESSPSGPPLTLSGPLKLPKSISRQQPTKQQPPKPPSPVQLKNKGSSTLAAPLPNTFLRPAGIDAPSQSSSLKQNKRKAAEDSERTPALSAGISSTDPAQKHASASMSSSAAASTSSSQATKKKKKKKSQLSALDT